MPEPNDTSMQDLKPTVWIGKQGSTETMIEEIVSQLKKRRLIKVKWLQNTEVDPVAIAAQAKARLVDVRGRTMVLAEKGRAAGSPPAHVKAPVKATAKETAKKAVKKAVRAPARVPARAPEKQPARSPPNVMRKEPGAARSRKTGSMKAAKK
jgi:RNA-binding protein